MAKQATTKAGRKGATKGGEAPGPTSDAPVPTGGAGGPKGARDEASRVGAAPAEAGPAAEWVGVATLKPWVKNPRKNDENANRVAQSIIRFGFGAPIVARREDGEIIAGHTRTKAVLLLKGLWSKATDRERAAWHPDAVTVAERQLAPVRYLNLSSREAHLLALADNRLNELSPWDQEGLKDAMGEFSLPEIELAGWTGADLEVMGVEILGDEGGGGAELVVGRKKTKFPSLRR